MTLTNRGAGRSLDHPRPLAPANGFRQRRPGGVGGVGGGASVSFDPSDPRMTGCGGSELGPRTGGEAVAAQGPPPEPRAPEPGAPVPEPGLDLSLTASPTAPPASPEAPRSGSPRRRKGRAGRRGGARQVSRGPAWRAAWGATPPPGPRPDGRSPFLCSPGALPPGARGPEVGGARGAAE